MFGNKKNEEEQTPKTDVVTVEMGKNAPVEKLQNKDDMLFLKCTECGGIHFRHAGYVESCMPYARANKTTHMQVDSLPVMICINCKRAYVYYEDKYIDVTDHIDLDAWEKTEKEAYRSTGPGGQC